MQDGERQVAPNLSGIRRDHLARYEWAAKTLKPASRVIDLACGIGYGANIMAHAGHRVLAVDQDAEAIAYAALHYAHSAVTLMRSEANAFAAGPWVNSDAAVCFETIEHVEDPLPVLKTLNRSASLLLASVPNEAVFPYKGQRFHHRHYTADEFQALLNEAGWEVVEWHGQVGPESEVEPNVNGRTLIAVCSRARKPKLLPFEPAAAPTTAPAQKGPGHVVIIGLGPSAEQYVDLVKRLGGRRRFADEVWAINALGDVLQCDRVFHMDDVRVQELRAAEKPDSNIAEMVRWLKNHPGPVITSRAHPDYPGLVEFPLEEVINNLGYAYFNGTAAYAVAYAIHLGASRISFYGCDYTYANAHHAEQGRACMEFWIGYAAARGIALGVADSSSLLDTVDSPKDPNELGVYGYDFDRVMVDSSDGSARVRFEPKPSQPTAAEIEHRYDHTRHPSPLLRGETSERTGP